MIITLILNVIGFSIGIINDIAPDWALDGRALEIVHSSAKTIIVVNGYLPIYACYVVANWFFNFLLAIFAIKILSWLATLARGGGTKLDV